MHLEQERGPGLAGEKWRHAVPRHIASARRQVKVEAQRVDLRRAGVVAAGAEVVMQMEEDSAVEGRLDQLQRIGSALRGDDVRVPDIEAKPDRRRGDPLR